jgi:serine/threonine protein kinase
VTPENAAVAEGALIGHCIDERYRLEAVIGVGGLGSVYRATHTKLQRPVAVKLLHESFGESQIQRGRFAREAKALAALQHPNIVAVLDYGVSDAQPYLVMELLEGETLSQRLHEGPLPLTSALRIAQQLLEALSFMHRARLVHRDVKPSNVFLVRGPEGNDRVKVLDFGLAKFTAAPLVSSDPTLTRDGAILGTPAYMSPEQATGEIVDARSDVYAVGVILFRMLAGRLPFEGDAIEQVRSHLIAPVPPINRPNPETEIDAALQAFIGRAMEKRREDRYADAGQMLKALVESFPQHVQPTLPEHEPVLPDPFAVDALNADWLLSMTDASSETPTLPRDPRAPAEFTRTRESVQRVGRAFRTLVVTSVRLFAGISVLLVVGAGAIYVLLLRSEADRVELTALQRRVQDRLLERSTRRAQDTAGAGSPGETEAVDPRMTTSPSTAKVTIAGAAHDTKDNEAALVAATPALSPPGAAPAQDAVASADPPAAPSPPLDAVPLPKDLETSVAAIEQNGPAEKLALPAMSNRLAAALEKAATQGAAVEALEQPLAHLPSQPLAAPSATTGERVQSASPLAAEVAVPPSTAMGSTTESEAATPSGSGAAPGTGSGVGQGSSSGVAAGSGDGVGTSSGSASGAGAGIAVGASSDGRKGSEPNAQASGSVAPASRSSSPSGVPAVDPWRAPVPLKLRAARRTALANGAGSESMVLALRAYNREQRNDPRGHLLLGQLYLNRFWRADALSQFTIAMTLDPSARGAPEVLPALLELVVQGELAPQANRVIINHFGSEALPAIESAIPRQRDSKAQARLRWLRSRLLQ